METKINEDNLTKVAESLQNNPRVNINYLDINDNAVVSIWFKQNTKSECMSVISLLADNLYNFEKLYETKPNQDANDPNIFFWNVNYQSIAYILKCDKANKTTTYFVQYNKNGHDFANDYDFGTYIISFLEFLLKNKMMRNLS